MKRCARRCSISSPAAMPRRGALPPPPISPPPCPLSLSPPPTLAPSFNNAKPPHKNPDPLSPPQPHHNLTFYSRSKFRRTAMPHTKTAKKRLRQNEKRRVRNRATKKAIKLQLRKVLQADKGAS